MTYSKTTGETTKYILPEVDCNLDNAFDDFDSRSILDVTESDSETKESLLVITGTCFAVVAAFAIGAIFANYSYQSCIR